MEPVLQLCHPLFIDLSGRTRLQVAARFLAGNPMSAAECGHFCLTEQINALRRNFGVRFTEMFCSPYYRLKNALAIHRRKHRARG